MDDNQTSMRPEKGSTKIKVPISWDVKKVNRRNIFVLITILGVLLIFAMLATFGFVTSKASILAKLLVIPAWYLIILSIRLFTFHEGRISDEYEEEVANDYKTDISEFWDIYEIDAGAPHIVHYASGSKGIFVQFKKDVIQGKQDSIEYDHYEAIAEAMRQAQEDGLSIVPIDYMDNVGNDERLDELFKATDHSRNEALKDALVQIYSNLQYMMAQSHSSFDIVLLYSDKMSSEELWTAAQNTILMYLEANYRSYTILDEKRIRMLAQELFNLTDFSVIEAEQLVLSAKTTNNDVIRPLKIKHPDGSIEQLNLPIEEERRLNELKKQQQLNNSKRDLKLNRKSDANNDEDELEVLRQNAIQTVYKKPVKFENAPLDIFTNGTAWDPDNPNRGTKNPSLKAKEMRARNITPEQDPFGLFSNVVAQTGQAPQTQTSPNNIKQFDLKNADNQKQAELVHRQADAGWVTSANNVADKKEPVHAPGHHPELTPQEQIDLTNKAVKENFKIDIF